MHRIHHKQNGWRVLTRNEMLFHFLPTLEQ